MIPIVSKEEGTFNEVLLENLSELKILSKQDLKFLKKSDKAGYEIEINNTRDSVCLGWTGKVNKKDKEVFTISLKKQIVVTHKK